MVDPAGAVVGDEERLELEVGTDVGVLPGVGARGRGVPRLEPPVRLDGAEDEAAALARGESLPGGLGLRVLRGGRAAGGEQQREHEEPDRTQHHSRWGRFDEKVGYA